MAEITIRKRLDLGFLGPEHTEDYLVFNAIPVGEYTKILENQPKGNVEALNFIVKLLGDRFISGSFQKQDVKKEDLSKFDAEVVTECFLLLTGQKTDPKA